MFVSYRKQNLSQPLSSIQTAQFAVFSRLNWHMERWDRQKKNT